MDGACNDKMAQLGSMHSDKFKMNGRRACVATENGGEMILMKKMVVECVGPVVCIPVYRGM